jgi:RecA/RadA recombinase
VRAPSAEIGLIVLDSATGLYRLVMGTEEETQSRTSLTYQMINLMTVSRKLEVPTVITSQVYTSFKKDKFEPLGGHTLSHYAKTIIFLEKLSPGARRATIVKHRSFPEGASVVFHITGDGISDEAPAEKPHFEPFEPPEEFNPFLQQGTQHNIVDHDPDDHDPR